MPADHFVALPATSAAHARKTVSGLPKSGVSLRLTGNLGLNERPHATINLWLEFGRATLGTQQLLMLRRGHEYLPLREL